MYVLQEMQTTNGVTALVPPQVFANLSEAESAYHFVLAAAAISNVGVHTAKLFDEHGNDICKQYYEHQN